MAEPLFSLPVENDPYKKKFSPFLLAAKIVLPLFIFFIAMWLVFSKLQKTPAEKIEQALHQKDFKEAYRLVDKYLERERLSRLRLLMYGTLIQFGLEEQKEPLPQDFPNYQKLLAQEDSAFIFLKESYMRRMQMFPNSQKFLQLTCNFVHLFPSVYLDQQTQKLLAGGIESMGNWLPINHRCLSLIFDDAVPFFRNYLRLVNGTNVNLRKDPDTEGNIITTLHAGEKILLRKKGPALLVGGQQGHWQFVFTKEQKQGWIFDYYLLPLP